MTRRPAVGPADPRTRCVGRGPAFIDGADGEMDWRFVDEEFESYINEVLRSIDGMIFGRVTHELLASYRPTATSTV